MRRRTYGNKDIRGKYMYIVGSLKTLHYSSDYGKTFVSVRIDTGFVAWDAAISYSGQYHVLVGEGPIYSSSDYGKTWVKYHIGGYETINNVAISSDGKYITATSYNGKSRYSSDYGKTWKEIFIINHKGVFTSMSSSGKYQIVNTNTINFYYSNDYGESWVMKTAGGNVLSSGSAISANGKYQIITGTNNSFLNRSASYGDTWEMISTEYYGSDVLAMSDDGRKQMRSSSTRIITSYDYGMTWGERNDTPIKEEINSIFTYGDCRIQLIASGSEVYKSKDYGTTWESVPSPTNYIRKIAINK